MASAREVAEAAEHADVRNRWYLSLPALVVVMVAAVGPLFIMVVYSLLQKGDYGNVVWRFVRRCLVQVLLERDVFDDTLSCGRPSIDPVAQRGASRHHHGTPP
jgi:spermidine/putrescine transport system permease protein